MKRLGVLFIALACVACSKADRDTVAPAGPADEPEHAHGHAHQEFPATVGAFHDRMAPLWHAEVAPVQGREQTAAGVEHRVAVVSLEGHQLAVVAMQRIFLPLRSCGSAVCPFHSTPIASSTSRAVRPLRPPQPSLSSTPPQSSPG